MKRQLVLDKARADVLEKHEAQKKRVLLKQDIIAKKDPDFYQEWWDTLDALPLISLYEAIYKPRFRYHLSQLFGHWEPDETIQKLLVCDRLQFAVRERLCAKNLWTLDQLYVKSEFLRLGPDVTAPQRRWWRRQDSNSITHYDETQNCDILIPCAPGDFFNDVWMDAFSIESQMAGSPIEQMHRGLGKHAFADVVTQVRKLMYGETRAGSLPRGDIVNADRQDDHLRQLITIDDKKQQQQQKKKRRRGR